MFGIWVFGWILIVIAVRSAAALVYHSKPLSGRHAARSTRREIDAPALVGDVEETVIFGELFGTGVISGYSVGLENAISSLDGPRPYIKSSVQDAPTVEFRVNSWFEPLDQAQTETLGAAPLAWIDPDDMEDPSSSYTATRLLFPVTVSCGASSINSIAA